MDERDQQFQPETIELEADHEAGTIGAMPPVKRGPDVAALLVGLLTLAMAVAAFVGAVPDLSGFDLRWVLAAAATLIGAFLLVNGIRQRTRTRQH